MGQSGSTSSSAQSTTIINNNTLVKAISEQCNTAVNNVSVTIQNTCQASSSQIQGLTFGPVAGDFTLTDVDLSQQVALDLSCLQKSTVRNDIAAEMFQQVVNKLSSLNNTDVMDKMVAAAKGASLTTSPVSSSTSDIYKQNTNVNINVQNVVKNAIENNFSQKTYSDCIAANFQQQAVSVASVGGSVNIARFKAGQVSTLLAKCIQDSGASNAIASKISQDLGSDNSFSTSTTKTSDQSASAQQSGLLQDFFNGINSILSTVLSSWVYVVIAGLFFLAIIAYLLGPTLIGAVFGGDSGGSSAREFDPEAEGEDEREQPVRTAIPFRQREYTSDPEEQAPPVYEPSEHSSPEYPVKPERTGDVEGL